MKNLDKKSMLLGALVPILAIVLMGAANVLSRYHTIEAQEIHLVDEKGNIISTFSDLNFMIEGLSEVKDRIRRLSREVDNNKSEASPVNIEDLEKEIKRDYYSKAEVDSFIETIKDDCYSKAEVDSQFDLIASHNKQYTEIIEKNDLNWKNLNGEIENLTDKYKSFKRSTNRKIKDIEFSMLAPLRDELKGLKVSLDAVVENCCP